MLVGNILHTIGSASVAPRGVYDATCKSWHRYDVVSWVDRQFDEIDSFRKFCECFLVSGDILRASIDRYLLFGDLYDVERYIGWEAVKAYDLEARYDKILERGGQFRMCFALVGGRIHEIILLSAEEANLCEIGLENDEIGFGALLFSRSEGKLYIEDVAVPLNITGKNGGCAFFCAYGHNLILSEQLSMRACKMDLLFPIFRVVVDKLNTKIALFYKKEALYNLSYKFAHCQAVVNAIKDLSSSGKGLLVPLDDDCELLWDVAKIICVDDSLHDELPDKVMLARNGKWCQIDGDIQKLVNSCLAG